MDQGNKTLVIQLIRTLTSVLKMNWARSILEILVAYHDENTSASCLFK